MRRTITRSLGLGTAALLAATTLGAQPGSASGPTGSSAGRTGTTAVLTQGSANRAIDGSDRAARAAVTGLAAHPREALRTAGQRFVARDAVLDRSGATHVRLDRTYRGLPVIGGDLVVHQGADARWLGVSQTLTKPLDLSTTPKLTGPRPPPRPCPGPPRPATSPGCGRRARRAWSSRPCPGSRASPGR